MSPALPPTAEEHGRPVLRSTRCRTTATASWCHLAILGPSGSTAGLIHGAGGAGRAAAPELWQLDEAGSVKQQEGSLRRDGWTFTGWGRASTDDTGTYTFTTLKPGAETGQGGVLSDHALRSRAARTGWFTRAYIPQDAAVLEAEPLLSSLTEAGTGQR